VKKHSQPKEICSFVFRGRFPNQVRHAFHNQTIVGSPKNETAYTALELLAGSRLAYRQSCGLLVEMFQRRAVWRFRFGKDKEETGEI
jgi:hypothetical protein